jgi:hypothetical protein
VILASGGPDMTVGEIRPDGNMVLCAWFAPSEPGRLQWEELPWPMLLPSSHGRPRGRIIGRVDAPQTEPGPQRN